MKKRVLKSVLTLLVCLGLTLSAAAASGSNGKSTRHWSADSVDRALELGVFQDTDDEGYSWGQPITRADFTAALTRLFRWEEVRPKTPTFSDVAPDRWYYTVVETAYANGAIAAAGNTFRPTDGLVREEMAAMLVRALGYTPLAGTVSRYSTPFTDVSTNKGFIIVAYDTGLLSGVGDGRFDPSGIATREQAATALMRVYDRLYTRSVPLSSAGSYRQILVPSPKADAADEVPTTPLEPLPELYDALRKLKGSGADMSRAALCLKEGGVRTVTGADGRILSSSTLSAKEVNKLLSRKDVNLYYSERYESAYFIYQPKVGQTATVWYQNEESMAAKLQMARLFGVTRYVLQ